MKPKIGNLDSDSFYDKNQYLSKTNKKPLTGTFSINQRFWITKLKNGRIHCENNCSSSHKNGKKQIYRICGFQVGYLEW